MKKAYKSPELDKEALDTDVVLASVVSLGDGDWGVQDDFA